jgi:hypothetical protein
MLDQNADLWTQPVSVLQLIDVKLTQIQRGIAFAAEEETGHEAVQSAELLLSEPPGKDTFGLGEAQSGYRPPEVAPAPGEDARLDRLL